LAVGSKNVAHPIFVAPCKALLPSLLIKLWGDETVSRLETKKGNASNTCQIFVALAAPNLKELKILSDSTFESTVNATENAAWQVFIYVITTFIDNKKNRNCTRIVNEMLDAFKDLCCNMSLNIYFLKSDLHNFPENLESLSAEQGKRFH
jgi:hypothetical protein